jgi:hypothetical protein
MWCGIGSPLSERTLRVRVIRVRRPVDSPEPCLIEAAGRRTLASRRWNYVRLEDLMKPISDQADGSAPSGISIESGSVDRG